MFLSLLEPPPPPASSKLGFFWSSGNYGLAIWKGRNEFVFNGSPINPMTVVEKYEGAWVDYSRDNSLEERGVDGWITASSQAKWAPPPVRCVMVSFFFLVYMETPVDDKFITTESLVGAKLDLLDVGTNQEPNEGMSFESDEAAKAFYVEYARRIGFLTRIVSSRKSEHDGSVISRRRACNKEGYNCNSRKTGPCRIRKRESHREGCMAMVLVKREKLGEWVVTKFVREHNHPLEVSSEKWRPNPDQKIRELSSQLHHANQQLEACQEQLRTIMACMDEHTQCLSTTVESVVSNVKQVESQQHEISGHY
ncbi:hypothetical protein RHMOL_Rhmol02G0087900 [Rhododendron molle]|uniref:Uncharacterized protein n=1 Tax=Rhododendron molle TaxID=49168 RepID=A0ACC0PPK5_RHOML|nr:hypothetical protein RHMOL_Rhmol02G0087900 [Rhododendron molle]